MKFRTVIADDNALNREQLRLFLKFHNNYDIIAEFDNTNDANDFLLTADVDLVFINLQMGNCEFSNDGGYLSWNVTYHRPELIVIGYTDFDFPVGKICKANCTDYFVFPMDEVIMQRVLNRIRQMAELLEFRRQSQNRSIMVKTNQGYQLVFLHDILFIERFNRKNRMITTDGRQIMLNGYTMDELTQLLISDGFYRCYQSYIVNLSKVSSVRVDNSSKNYSLRFDGYSGEIMLSRDKYSEIVHLLKNKYARISL